MMGLLFNLFEEVLARRYGEDAWDRLLEAVNLDGVYTSVGNYPEGELDRLVHAASASFCIPDDELLRWFGREAIPLLVERFPEFFAPHQSTFTFLMTLDQVIHPEVRKFYADSVVPEFDFEMSSADTLKIGYRSPRKLCALAEGLVLGAADYYGDRVQVEQTRCMKRGDDKCLWLCSWRRDHGTNVPGTA